ncbi:MBL fold metallo-hydrolase [Crassaminicella thermophila]|uniref:MBL fold metallo-hydrolase n=2 Tax=Crassaminicella thermophila TaxID=2599308 RepID=A0A5C0SH66_CRATE|nr:ComEC/Rec2 family competence protein [Crassaminicella thermophila]QEK13540.1 MBL fold metallo-hydrolase [Crassaminicella thermophila]
MLLSFFVFLTACSKNKTVETMSNVRNDLEVHFMDVGQADAIFIKKGQNTMLIDAGNNEDADWVVNYLKNQGIKKIDYVIGTHPHEDHIGGLDAVINSFDIGKVYMPKVTHTSKTFKDVIHAVKNKGLKISNPVVGSKIALGDAKGVILAPNSDKYKDYNNYSIVLKLTYGNTSFLFTGDAEGLSEKEMIDKGLNLSADVLKVGHHGSNSSTTLSFLNKVNPEYAVIMTGTDNDYGHPHKETMDKLKNKGIIVYRTDQNGTIVAISDGEHIKFNTNPGNYRIGRKSNTYVDEYGKGMIKGNINSKGERIYHMPDGAYYNKVKAEIWFKTEKEAKEAGFRKSKK